LGGGEGRVARERHPAHASRGRKGVGEGGEVGRALAMEKGAGECED
jgi:hypothetical protein